MGYSSLMNDERISLQRRCWEWWRSVANRFAHEVFIDPPRSMPTATPKRDAPLSATEKVFLVLTVSLLTGWLAWQVPVIGDSTSWPQRNSELFGGIVGAVIFALGLLVLITINTAISSEKP
jgi:hypothetical protein